MHAFFCKEHFDKQRQAEIEKKKNKANAKQHHETVLLLFDNYSYSSSTLSFKNNGTFLKIKQKSKRVFSHEIPRLIIIKIKMEMKNRSHRYLG